MGNGASRTGDGPLRPSAAPDGTDEGALLRALVRCAYQQVYAVDEGEVAELVARGLVLRTSQGLFSLTEAGRALLTGMPSERPTDPAPPPAPGDTPVPDTLPDSPDGRKKR